MTASNRLTATAMIHALILTGNEAAAHINCLTSVTRILTRFETWHGRAGSPPHEQRKVEI
jgi:hypothetical protein